MLSGLLRLLSVSSCPCHSSLPFHPPVAQHGLKSSVYASIWCQAQKTTFSPLLKFDQYLYVDTSEVQA